MEAILAEQPGGLENSIAESIPNIGVTVAKSKYLGKVTTMLIGAFALAINVLPNYGCAPSEAAGIKPRPGIEYKEITDEKINQQSMCRITTGTKSDKCKCFVKNDVTIPSGECGKLINYYNN